MALTASLHVSMALWRRKVCHLHTAFPAVNLHATRLMHGASFSLLQTLWLVLNYSRALP